MSFNEFLAVRILFTLHDDAFISWQFCIGATAANGLTSQDTDLFLGWFLYRKPRGWVSVGVLAGFVVAEEKLQYRSVPSALELNLPVVRMWMLLVP